MAWMKVRALVVGAVTVLCLPMTAHTAADPTKVLRVSSHDIASLDPQQGTDLFSTRVATEIFDRVLAGRDNQLERLRQDVQVTADELLDFTVPGGEITDAGLHANVSVGVRYLDSWLQGVAAVFPVRIIEVDKRRVMIAPASPKG